MLRRVLRRWLYENAAIKLVALILSITLFILVSGEKVSERSLRVGVAYVRPEDRALVSSVPDSVDVWVRGPWTRIKRLDPADVDPIVVDLTKIGDGEVRLNERDIRVPAGLEVRSIRPATVQIAFERQKRLPVLPELVGVPPEGFYVERVVAEPAVIAVRGAENALHGLAEVRTLPVSVAGKRAAFREKVSLAPLGPGVESDVDSVDLDVQIVEEMRERRLPATPVTVEPPSGAARPAGTLDAAPPVVDIVLRGGAEAMRKLDTRKIQALVESRVEDFVPGATRAAPVLVTGAPPGVAVEVRPREISLSNRAAGGAKLERQPP
jgi:YbbR domain-containing protein